MKEKMINISATLAGISLIALILRPVQPQAKINQQSAVLSECYNSHVDYKVETGEISVDGYELSLMAHLLMGECGATCNDDEMLYLAGAVVLNRDKVSISLTALKKLSISQGNINVQNLKTADSIKNQQKGVGE